MEFTRVNNDINGNPRYVVHFLDLLTKSEYQLTDINKAFNTALKRARQIGGKKYRGKDYGGGIVFQSYNTRHLQQHIERLLLDVEFGASKIWAIN